MAGAAVGIVSLVSGLVQTGHVLNANGESSGSAAGAVVDAIKTANAAAGAKHDQETARSLTDIAKGAGGQLGSHALARMASPILAPMPAIGADEDALGSLVDNDGFVMGKPEDRRAAYGEYLALIYKMAGGGLEPEPADANRLLAPLGLSLRSRGGEGKEWLTHGIDDSVALRAAFEGGVDGNNDREQRVFLREVGAADNEWGPGDSIGFFSPGGPDAREVPHSTELQGPRKL